MRLLWIGFAPFQQGSGPMGLTSDAASARYRILAPAGELQKKNHSVTLAFVTKNQVPQELLPYLASDAVIFSKSFSDINEALARTARERKAAIIFDVCDNYFEHPVIGQHYRNMVRDANTVTCNTERMAELARQYTNKPCIVIEDTYDGTRQKAAFSPGDTLKLVWFGHPSNADSLKAALPSLVKASKQQPVALTVVSQSKGAFDGPAFCAQLQAEAGFPIRFVPWSLQSQQDAIRAGDLVIIPSLDNDVKNVKSANRMMEAFLAGRMVVAAPIPSYEPFKDWAWLGEDLFSGIEWARKHQNDIPVQIDAAQDYIEQHFSPETIGRKWEHVIAAAVAADSGAQAKSGMRR
jgi:hypothetical protein